jgi:hypothetical protein
MKRGRMMAVVAVAALVGAGCGGDDGDGTAVTGDDTTTTTTQVETERGGQADLERIAEAAENTADEGTARYTITVATADTGLGDDGEQPVDVEGEVDFDAEQRRLIFQAETGTTEILVDGTELYIEMPATEDEQWARLDLDELIEGDVAFGLAGMPFQDPAQNLDALRDSATRVEVASEDQEVDGETTTQYKVFLDLEQGGAEADSDAGDAVQEGAEETGVREIEMDVWIDEDDLIRRLAYTVDLEQAEVDAEGEGGEAQVDPSGEVTVTMDFMDFGVDVEIEFPDDDAIVDLDEQELRDMVEGLGGGTGGSGGTGGTGGTTTTTADTDDDDTDDDDTGTGGGTGTTTTTSTTTTTTAGD